MATAQVVLPGYMRKGDAARYLNISIRTLTDWMRSGIVACMKLSRKVCLFRQMDLDQAMTRYRVNATGEYPAAHAGSSDSEPLDSSP